MITIAVIGWSKQGADEVIPEVAMTVAHEVGRSIAEAGAALVSGGTTGVMEAASRGAREARGLTIGILPGIDRGGANPYVDIALPTGLGTARNLIHARGCDALIMIGGGAGTLNELTIAYQGHRNVVVIEGTGGWADRIRYVLVDGRYVDERRVTEIFFARTAGEAVTKAVSLAREIEAREPVADDPGRWLAPDRF